MRLLTLAMMGVSVVFAGFVLGVYMLATSGGDDASPGEAASPPQPADGAELPFGGTPVSELAGVPTPQPGTGPLDDHRPEVGEPVPDFVLADVHDPSATRQLSDYLGTPIVLNWYASWCGPCEDELPDFQAAQDALGDDIVFFAVNFLESQDDAARILDRHDVTFPAVMDSSGEVSEHYRINRGLPTTMLIDGEGVLQSVHYGPLFGDDLERELTNIGVDYRAE